ncbi:MAG: prepilin-type N-terminal cleavage/methylation domain-containing protein [Candidatus Curtissbacteria bacterium]|nr:prepilin-type N-terminal cleavage/methylation domain-containing protein [Candidatus Curtissbacteria bacterium]
MPFLDVNRRSLIAYRRAGFKKTVNCRLWRQGFTLIELMIVISLFGIAASLITASYLNFEKNQRVQNAADKLKADLRLVQNKATSGDKGPGGLCPSTSSLGGWYLRVERNQSLYSFGGVCLASFSSESTFSVEVVNLPEGVKVNTISYTGTSSQSSPVAIFFRPLANDIKFHNASSALGAPVDFFETNGALRNLLSPAPTSAVTIQLSDLGGTRLNNVVVDPSGEVKSFKP